MGAGPSGSIASALLKRRGLRRAGARAAAVSALLHRREPARALPRLRRRSRDAGGGGSGRLPEQERRRVRAQRRRTPTTTSATASRRPRAADRPSRCNGRRFDKILADEAEKQGVEIRYEVEITAVSEPDAAGRRTLTARDVKSGEVRPIEADFILGCERLRPHVAEAAETRDAVRRFRRARRSSRTSRITFPRRVRPQEDPRHRASEARRRVVLAHSVLGGRSSLGVVAAKEYLDTLRRRRRTRKLRTLVAEDHGLASLLGRGGMGHAGARAARLRGQREVHGRPGIRAARECGRVSRSRVLVRRHDCHALRQHGRRYAASSSSRARTVDWKREFEEPLRKGVDCFRAYVDAWYDGRFQKVVFHPGQTPEIRRMISSVLAGYAWDERNPFVARSAAAAEQCCGVGGRMSGGARTRSVSHRLEPRIGAPSRCARRATGSTSSSIAARSARRPTPSPPKSSSLGRASRVLQFDVVDRALCAELLTKDIEANGTYYGVVCNAGPCLRHRIPRDDRRAVGQHHPQQSRRVLQRAAAADHADGASACPGADHHDVIRFRSRRQSRAGKLQRRESGRDRCDQGPGHRAREAQHHRELRGARASSTPTC